MFLCIHSMSYTPFQFRLRKFVLVQDGNLRALVTGRSLFRFPFSGTTFLLTSDTAILSHSSKLLSKLFSLLLPTLNYSNPFTGIGCCTWFDLDFAADVFTSWQMCSFVVVLLGGMGGGERGGKRGVAKLCVCGCGSACVWMQRRRNDRVRYAMHY